MASAPRPSTEGYDAEAESTDAAKKVMLITVRRAFHRDGSPVTETLRFTPGNVSFRERNVLRKETGLGLSSYLGMNAFDVDTLQVLWWLARRANGEPFLTLDRALESWPEDLTEDDIELVEDDGRAEVEDSPEASGPAS